MNRFIRWNSLILVLAGFLFAGCHQQPAAKETQKIPLPVVKITYPKIENKDLFTKFQGVSRYLQSVHFSSKSTGVVSSVLVQPGDEVKKGQPLLVLKPVEISALEKTEILSSQMRNIRDTVFSMQTVLVNHILVQEGDYVQPGTLLVSAFKKSSLSALVYVPFHDVSLIKMDNRCTVEIPGKGKIESHFGKKLFLADSSTQTQPFVVPLPSSLLLASGINLTVQYKTNEIKNGLFIPRKSLLANEEETKFQVMKIGKGNTAVKVPVTVGWQGKRFVQILSGNLSIHDRVITEGAYGLPEGTKVQVIK